MHDVKKFIYFLQLYIEGHEKIFTEKVYIYGNHSLIFSQILYFEWFSLVY